MPHLPTARALQWRAIDPVRRRLVLCVTGLVLAGLLVGLALLVVPWRGSSAAGPGNFTVTGPMAIAREYHTATLLEDGRVLIAGGGLGHPLAAEAELYDPATGTFRTTGALGSLREGHTATLLQDGRVLIAGGEGPLGSVVYASAELYDPKTGTFGPTGSMITSRYGHTATLLQDGRVLIMGGWTGAAPIASAELYDPKTGTFSATGSSLLALREQTATLLSDGQVLIAGGNDGSAALASTELYDPATGKFRPAGSMARPRQDHAATLLADGRVLITGGGQLQADGTTSGLASTELYDPRTGTFGAAGSMTTGRNGHSATLLADGRVLVVGGSAGSAEGTELTSAELYDPATGAFVATGSMAAAHYGAPATLLRDGRVLIAGASGLSSGLPSAELYRP